MPDRAFAVAEEMVLGLTDRCISSNDLVIQNAGGRPLPFALTDDELHGRAYN